MGFLSPDLPTIDLAQWRNGTHGDRIRVLAQHLAERGFGTPDAMRYFHVVRIVIYIVGALAFALSTNGIDGWGSIGSWWREPIVFQKLVLWSLLFEALGLGCGFGVPNSRWFAPIDSPLRWLRPGTIRLPPWPNRLLLTKGDTRTPFDAALYGLFVVATVFALLSDGTGPDVGLNTTIGVIPVWKIADIVGLLTLLGLRDKAVFLAARGEVYGTFTVAFLFTGTDMIIAAKLVMVVIWVGAAASKFQRHAPFAIASMMSNSPIIPAWVKRRFYQRFPDDLRPGRLSRLVAYGGTFVEFTAPLVLLCSPGIVPVLGDRLILAATALVLFHLAILSSMPIGVPLEWNAFMIFGIFTLFLDKADLGLDDLKHPVPVAILMVVVVGTVILGNVFPGKVWLLPTAMRNAAGNGNTTRWCLTPAAAEQIEKNVVMFAGMPRSRLEKHYGKDEIEIESYLGYALRAMTTHGRALFTLTNRAIPPGRGGDYTTVDGEWICGAAVGWHFGDGSIHNEQLVAALQRRCQFGPAEVRIVMLNAQPIHRQIQRYRLVDAAIGEFERGVVRVADMVTRQPWADDVPVHVADTVASTK
jgi:hypothetical protein